MGLDSQEQPQEQATPAPPAPQEPIEELPFHGVSDVAPFERPGGRTRIGIPLDDQAQIGENIVAKMGEIPGYGPITWWHQGGAVSPSPLDGATPEWGLEVKTLNYDNIHHRFIPGRDYEKGDKNAAATQMGLKGILGILVMLDYRRDVADIYVREFPLGAWTDMLGRPRVGIGTFRKHNGTQLVSEIPFESPYKNPANPTPLAYSMADFYRKPQALDYVPPTPESEMAF